jgi:predicted small metal-binding protein
MTKVISCRDVGVDCDFVARGQTEEEILQQVAEHARTAHGMNELSPELAEKVRSGIREEGEEKVASTFQQFGTSYTRERRVE